MVNFVRLPRGLLLAALGAIGCLSAQTASADDCASSDSCVCDGQYPLGSEANPPTGALLRVRATAVAERFLQAELLEVVGPSNGFELQPGDVLGRLATSTGTGAGSVLSGLPCSNDRSAIVVGAELLVYYHPSQPDRSGGHLACEQFRNCATPKCDPLETRVKCEQACAAETATICDDEALLNGYFSWAVPWGPELDFGSGHRLARSDLAVLFEADSCRAAFPAPPQQPCNEYFGCVLAPSKSSAGGAGSGLLGLALCAVSWRLRRSRVGAAR